MRYCDTLIKIQRNPGISSPFLVRTQILVKENKELLPHHTIVLETEWDSQRSFSRIGTHYRLDFPQNESNGGHHDMFYWS